MQLRPGRSKFELSMTLKTKIDWPALKAEFLASQDNPHSFMKRKKLLGKMAIPTFYKIVSEQKWLEDRADINQKALDNTKRSLVEQKTKEWDRQIKLWHAVEGIAAKIMSMRANTMDGGELAQLSSALERALKSQRLILGESTENISEKSMSLRVLKIVEQVEGNASEPE